MSESFRIRVPIEGEDRVSQVAASAARALRGFNRTMARQMRDTRQQQMRDARLQARIAESHEREDRARNRQARAQQLQQVRTLQIQQKTQLAQSRALRIQTQQHRVTSANARAQAANARATGAGARAQAAQLHAQRAQVNLWRSQLSLATQHQRINRLNNQTTRGGAGGRGGGRRPGLLGRLFGGGGGGRRGGGSGTSFGPLSIGGGGGAGGGGFGGFLSKALPVAFLGYGVGQVLDNFVQGPLAMATRFDQANITMEVLIGNAARAQQLLADLYKFAADTPLRFEPLMQGAQQLLQWGFSVEQVMPMLKTIASASAAMPEPEMAQQGIIRAIGQMRLRGRALMEEINQLQDQGVPALQMIAEGYGISTNELIKWMETGVRPAILEGKRLRGAIDILMEAMSGRYAGILERQADTIGGVWSTLSDIFSMEGVLQWGRGLAEGLLPPLRELRDWLNQNEPTVKAWGQGLRDIGRTLSTTVAGGARNFISGMASLFMSPEWANANTLGERVGLITSHVGQLLWGNAQGQHGLVSTVWEWVRGQAITILESSFKPWATEQWTNFSNMVGEHFGGLVSWFKGEFADMIESALKALIPWWGGRKGNGPGAAAGSGAGSMLAGTAVGAAFAGAAGIAKFFLDLPQTSKFMVPNGISFGGGAHRGIDMSAGAGTNIPSPVAGTLVDPAKYGLSAGYGRAITVMDPEGRLHIFGHTAGLDPSRIGTNVFPGDVLGQVGALANKAPGEISTGEHIHYEIREGGDFNRQVNPDQFLHSMMNVPRSDPNVAAGVAAAQVNASAAESAASGGVTVESVQADVTVNGAGDPQQTADTVVDALARTLARKTEEVMSNRPVLRRPALTR